MIACIRPKLEAPPGFEPGVEVLQTSALPLGDGAPVAISAMVGLPSEAPGLGSSILRLQPRARDGAGNGIRTRDFDLGKVALYH